MTSRQIRKRFPITSMTSDSTARGVSTHDLENRSFAPECGITAIRVAWWVASLLLVPVLAVAQVPAYTTCVTNAQMRHFQTVRDPILSPNGREVVWVQFQGAVDAGTSHLWEAPVNGSAVAHQITSTAAPYKFGESQPRWLPSGSSIFFTASGKDKRQLFEMPAGGGKAAPIKLATNKLTLHPERFAVSPDGRWIAFSARQPETKQQKQDKKDKKDAVVVGRNLHPTRIWLYSMADHRVVALTPLTQTARGFAWNPDSKAIAISAGAAKNASELPPDQKLYIVTVASPHTARVVQGVPPTVEAFRFSPNGHQIAYLAQSEHDTPPGFSDLYVISATGGTPRDLSSASPFAIGGFGSSIIWAEDGNAIYVQAQRGTTTALVKFARRGNSAPWQPAATPVAGEFDTNRDQSGWTFVAQTSDRMPQVVFARTPAAAGKVLSTANANWPKSGWRAATNVSWKSSDNLTIHGLYYPPAACKGAASLINGKYPMILRAHGGPTGAFTQSFDLFVQWLTTQGWAVLEVNPRGSTGYGWQFTAADRNDLGGGDFHDEMAGLDWALAHKPVDPKRLGMFGYSYGGEMAGYIEGKTDRFAAIVAGAPVIDQYSEYGTEHDPYYDRWFFGRPWQHPGDAWRQSPLAYAKNAKTPLLLLQGQADTTDPIQESEQEYRALFEDGAPVRLVTFPRDNHGPLALSIFGFAGLSHEPWHGYEAREQILAWYKEHFVSGS